MKTYTGYEIAMDHMAEKFVRLDDVEAVRAALENIVCPTGEDSGMILLSDESPTHTEEVNGQKVSVYDHDHFSPLGDALVALHGMFPVNV